MPDYEEASAAVAAVEVIQALQKQACLRRPEADMHQLLAALLLAAQQHSGLLPAVLLVLLAAARQMEGAAGLLAAMPELAAVLLPCPGGQQEQKQAAQRALQLLQLLWQLHRGAVAASQVGCSIFCG
jgi:hypothetical protein